jgi:hypothetical protein
MPDVRADVVSAGTRVGCVGTPESATAPVSHRTPAKRWLTG